MGSVHGKPSSTYTMKKPYRSRSRSGGQSSSVALSVIIRGLMVAVAASSLPFLIIYTLPSLQGFVLDVLPRLWRWSCFLFTPTNLFVLLNLLILSILAMAHMHSSPAASAAKSSVEPPPTRDDCARDQTSDDGAVSRSLSEAMELDDRTSADLQLVEQIHDQPSDHDAYQGDNQDDQDSSTGLMVLEEITAETHVQQKADDNGHHRADHQIAKKKADPESKKAEKAHVRVTDQPAPAQSKKAEKATNLWSCVQGNALPAPSHAEIYNIDSLLADEGSVFSRAPSRPLPSARFTHKKATKLSGLDRPLSPLKMSRPILKRGDTLDATWKAICESKRHSSPLNRHHSKHTRKLDTPEEIIEGAIHKPRASCSSLLSPSKQRSKIMMNNLHDKEANVLSRREPSMPQEELNAKVESFISRFNERIRIQREKSWLDYMEMVGRGAT